MDLIVARKDKSFEADWGAGPRRCAVGRGGIDEKGGEGDGVTPIGKWSIRNVLYRADRGAMPKTIFPVTAIAKDAGWCDAPDDPNYNRPVQHPYPASAENLWREDSLYDILVVLGFNDDPVVAGLGSAIFLHVAASGYAPTEGCVALSKNDLRAALAQFAQKDCVIVR